MQIDEFDELPNYICVDCWMTIKTFYAFYRNVIEAQKQFILNDRTSIKVETLHEETVTSYVEDSERSHQIFCATISFETFKL